MVKFPGVVSGVGHVLSGIGNITIWLNLQVLAMVKFSGFVSGVGHVLSGFGNG